MRAHVRRWWDGDDPVPPDALDSPPPSSWQIEHGLSEGRLSLDGNREQLDSTRSRSVSLFGAMSVAVGFLAGQVDRASTPVPLLAAAIGTYCIAVAFLAGVNWPVVFNTHMHTGALLGRGWSELLPDRADAEMAHVFAKALHANRKVLRHVGFLFLGELVFAAASVALWAAALL